MERRTGRLLGGRHLAGDRAGQADVETLPNICLIYPICINKHCPYFHRVPVLPGARGGGHMAAGKEDRRHERWRHDGGAARCRL